MQDWPEHLQPVTVDGRRQRAIDNRRRIVEAMLALVRAGDVAPAAEAVAQQAGVGLRTVFRLFEDMDALHREVHGLMYAELAPLVTTPLPEAWPDRLFALIQRRMRVHEELLPLKNAADVQRFRSPFLAEDHRFLVRFQRKMVQDVLPPDFTDPVLIDAIDLAMSIEAWRRLRQDHGLDFDQATEVITRTVRALIADHG